MFCKGAMLDHPTAGLRRSRCKQACACCLRRRHQGSCQPSARHGSPRTAWKPGVAAAGAGPAAPSASTFVLASYPVSCHGGASKLCAPRHVYVCCLPQRVVSHDILAVLTSSAVKALPLQRQVYTRLCGRPAWCTGITHAAVQLVQLQSACGNHLDANNHRQAWRSVHSHTPYIHSACEAQADAGRIGHTCNTCFDCGPHLCATPGSVSMHSS